ncbi:MAG TPA: MFS transporter [Candidatus Binataceae bacterium]|nr:MFS transporter [Candidatus Binataceae bacterium]
MAANKRGWLMVLVCFLTLVFLFGSSYNTASVFFSPLLKTFGWSRARVSSLATVLALAAGGSVPAIGWLLDRIEARLMMTAGALLILGGFILASQARSYHTMVTAYTLLGLGVAAGTLLPCSLVIANWFDAQLGLAMGLTMSGTALGGTLMAPICSRVIATTGWRAGYLVLAAPILVLVIPLVLLTIDTPSLSSGASPSVRPERLGEGLEIGEALRSRSLWLIAATQLLWAFAVTAVNLHMVPVLIGQGLNAMRAATILSLVLALSACGKLVLGLIADRAGGRWALAGGLLAMAVGSAALGGARHGLWLNSFILFYGLSCGAPLVLIPVVITESLGRKRYGSLAGFVGIFHTTGAALGPLAMGYLFDLHGSYTLGLLSCVAALSLGALLLPGARSLAQGAEMERVLATPNRSAI